MAPRHNVPLRELVYTISPYHVDVVRQTLVNWPKTASHWIQDKWFGLATFTGIMFAVQGYAKNYREEEKLHHRH